MTVGHELLLLLKFTVNLTNTKEDECNGAKTAIIQTAILPYSLWHSEEVMNRWFV